VTRLLERAGFGGALGESEVVLADGGAIAVVGLGPDPDAVSIRKAAAIAARRSRRAPEIVLGLVREGTPADAAEAAVEGALLGLYESVAYRSSPAERPDGGTLLAPVDGEAVRRASVVAGAVTLARDLTNEPASVLTPLRLAKRAQSMAERTGLTCKVWDADELERAGFGGLLSVAAGSAAPPCLIELRYAPADPSDTLKVLVGKGVTFDSGGINLKQSLPALARMKGDMAGGAAVIAAMGALRERGVRCGVLGLVPVTENMPGAEGTKPGDVIRHFGGRTTEVVNTDSEGRLILADALAYASTLSPACIVDVATLTSNMALGPRVTALMSNDDGLSSELLGAAAAAGEPMWRLPLLDMYRPSLDSPVADAKNQGYADGAGYHITSSLFLEGFVGAGVPWAHLDIVGPAHADEDVEEVSRGGTGIMVRTLLRFLEHGRA
jgi:leucyl aminopeptidase